MKLLLIDNNDSFTHNLEHLLVAVTGSRPDILPYREARQAIVREADIWVISPGPGAPAHYPRYAELLEIDTPCLGICLGMQLMNEHLGGVTEPLTGCFHGRAEDIEFEGRSIPVARYHSLHCSRVGDGLEVLCRNRTGIPMALGSKSRRLIGYQFHPESFLTSDGSFFLRYAFAYLGIHFSRTVSEAGAAGR